MKLNQIFALWAVYVLVVTVVSSSYVFAATYSSSSAVSVNYQPQPSFQTLYGSQADTYWPILGDKETCESREDILLQIAPFGCQPMVVRSDLLAEQDVPVFCQIEAININPLIDIERIKNIDFTVVSKSDDIVDVGFHPARAALRSQNTLLGSPLVNNIGYAVVLLKRQPVEAELPDFVNATLLARVSYDSGNAYGIGRSDFILEQVSYDDWESEKLKQSFWNGRYFVRLEGVDENYADISIYQGDRKVITTRVQKGQTSNEFFVPGMYCRAGLRVAYDDYVAVEEKARIEVSSGNSFDAFDVYEGSTFLDGRCSVRKIDIDEATGETGRVVGSCGGKQFVLELKNSNNRTSLEDSIFLNGKQYSIYRSGFKYWVDLSDYEDSAYRGTYYYEEGKLVREENGEVVVDSNGTVSKSIDATRKEWYGAFYSLIKEFVEGDVGLEISKPVSSQYYDEALESYETVADDYRGEMGGRYGKEALQKAIDLAREFGDNPRMIKLINRYLDLYPGDEAEGGYLTELENLRQFDASLAGWAIEFDEGAKVLRLLSLETPGKKASASFTVGGRSLRLSKDSNKDLRDVNKTVGVMKLDKVYVDRAEVGVYCMEKNSNGGESISSTKQSFILRVDEDPKKICGVDVRLDLTDVDKAVKVRLLPNAQGTQTETNLTVTVGIEKRAIELTPSKVRQKIENLNKTIEKWENILDKLGTVIKGMKGACFATAALLTFKNFMTGLSGEAIARQEVMRGENGWTERCKGMVPSQYPSLDACFIANSGQIDQDVAKTNAALNKVNAQIKQIQSGHVKTTDIFGKTADTEAVRRDLAKAIETQYGDSVINVTKTPWIYADGNQTNYVRVDELLSGENVNNSLISTEGLRSLMLNAELQKQGGLSGGHAMSVESNLGDIAGRVNQNMIVDREFQLNKANEKNGYPAAFSAGSATSRTRYTDVRTMTEAMKNENGFSGNVSHIAVIQVSPGLSEQGKEVKKFEAGTYYLGLEGDPQRGVYSIKEVVKKGDNTTQVDPVSFAHTYQLGNLQSLDGLSYSNEIQSSDRYVRYYETEPYKGMPAIVPFDTKEGWYAATRQTLPAFGGIGAFDASGRVTSFWVCNVGENGKIQFNSGYGDDLCQQINLNTGQPLNMFPGLDSSKATTLVQRAQRAIEEAARQYGNKFVSIDGERFEVGAPEMGVPGTNCQDFMSPKDCHLMFNVCDPVICPPSRCNLGGTYHVANVVQTGIIGSIFLCLPNIREGIFIPVCLTGIHAGIDGLVSIMKNYRDCLQESLDTGQMVGICDQIYSIYLCEFFWNQVAPFVNVIIPKLIELAYGQGVRGGAEYLSVMSAWQNMENSVDYFTQSYAVNSIQAFQARSVQEVGTEVCKAFISTKVPTDFDTLLEPDSPPQFHAWFDQKTFTTATVPATSQYKVFYHIFAGNDQGVHYSVYLRDPPTSGYYVANPTVAVASGYINKGEYASQTRDFTAPEGYKELCVRINNDEECGFAQVSSSFAVNYLRDSYISGEASSVTITSQKECVSGSNNPAALLNPNIQAGVEETISPEIYNRGIIRICSSQNPGSSTDPSRFTDVGYCDDPKIRCWIDKRSVEEAITQGNVGVLNDTLEVLDERTKQLLSEQGIGSEAVVMILQDLRSRVNGLSGGGSIGEALKVIVEANELFLKDSLVWNHQKAELYIIRGDAQAFLARQYRPADFEGRVVSIGTDEGPPSVGSSGDGSYSLVDSGVYGLKMVLYNGQYTKILYGNVTSGNGTFYDTTRPEDHSNEPGKDNVDYHVIGTVQNGIIDVRLTGVTDSVVKENIGRLNGKKFSDVFGGGASGNDGGNGGGEIEEHFYMDGDLARIDFSDGHSYAINTNDRLLYLLNGEWIDVRTDLRAHYVNKTQEDKDWLDGVFQRLVAFRESQQEQEEGLNDEFCGACRGGFIWWWCTYPECLGLGDCNYLAASSDCVSCSTVTSCGSYDNPLSCEANNCGVQGVLGCSWDNDNSKCISIVEGVPDGGGDDGGDGPCVIDNLRWEYRDGGEINLKVKNGEPVYLKADRSGSCDSVDTNVLYFVISEKDVSYDDVVSHINDVSLEGNTYVGEWAAEWVDENYLPWAEDGPEYYFEIWGGPTSWHSEKSDILGVMNEEYVPSEDDGGGDEGEPEPLTLDEMFSLRETLGRVYFDYRPDAETSPGYTGLYISLNEVGGKIIRNSGTGGAIVGSLSESIAAMRGAGKDPIITITNDIGVEVDGVVVFITSCLDGQHIAQQDGKLVIDFVSSEGPPSCPTPEIESFE
ncbi:MAG: hypothetical protein ABH864_02530 [archaeon]